MKRNQQTSNRIFNETDDRQAASQLEAFKDLGVITHEQYDELYALKHPVENVGKTL